MPRIDIIGTHYNKEDQFSEDGCTVECDGLSFINAEKQNNFNIMDTYMIGDKYMDGIIVDCFCHPESDCIWAVIKCLDVYFSVEFYHTGKYDTLMRQCEICDSTSMEMCLLIRHCPHWVDRQYNKNISKNGKKHIKDSTELSGGHLW